MHNFGERLTILDTIPSDILNDSLFDTIFVLTQVII